MDKETARELLDNFEEWVEFQRDNDCGSDEILDNLLRDIKNKRRALIL